MSHPSQRHRWPILLALPVVITLFAPVQGAGAATPFFSAPIDFDLEAAETDPYGNAAVPTSTLSLSEDEVAQVRPAGTSRSISGPGRASGTTRSTPAPPPGSRSSASK